jgi:hypothetical protein
LGGRACIAHEIAQDGADHSVYPPDSREEMR